MSITVRFGVDIFFFAVYNIEVYQGRTQCLIRNSVKSRNERVAVSERKIQKNEIAADFVIH